ncbi:MAG: NAD-dependent epimerase/dehydratase family protein [Candidatus Pacearchaeota archaeon]|nr:NAD-dependent epimerase/dehydratase family protein [Candidatus Pacearchaeota archaeon]
MKKALVCGAGGFIGSYLVIYLKNKGYWVRGVDIKYPEFSKTKADEFLILDLRGRNNCRKALSLGEGGFDEVYQLAADMGGMGFIQNAECDIMHNSALININMAYIAIKEFKVPRFFFSSSVCVYRDMRKGEKELTEGEAVPANPDNEYGWEKLYSERLYQAFGRKYRTKVRVARFQNCYGPEGTWRGGREKAPAALSRKIAEVKGDSGEIDVWGDGKARRVFVYIKDLLEGVYKIMHSDIESAVNLGPMVDVSIDDLVKIIAKIADKKIKIKHVDGPVGVESRNFSNKKLTSLDWKPNYSLEEGMRETYPWVEKQVKINKL